MSSSPSIVAYLIFLLVPLTLLQRCGAAVDTYSAYSLKSKSCSPPGYLTSNAEYQMDLQQLLDALPAKGIKNNGFFSGSNGSVYGMAMCQADIPWPDQCDGCLKEASVKAPEECPSSINATVGYQGCVLRYSDAPILVNEHDNISTAFWFSTTYHEARVREIAAFEQTRRDLFSSLASAAAVSPWKIASDNRPFNGSHKLYGLAQCNRASTSDFCSFCINASVTYGLPNLLNDLQWSEGMSINGFSFYIRYDLTPFEVYMPGNGSGASETKKGGLAQKVAIIVSPISVTIIILLVVFIVVRHYQKKWEIDQFRKATDLHDFSYAAIKSATGNFGETQRIGEGGFGKVYKGTFKIHGGDKVLAVKCIGDHHSAGKQLLGELNMLANLKHRNVVQLVGFCNYDGWFRFGKGLYVCNEYFSDGSLDEHISASKENPRGPLPWATRYQIIRGICTGLQYLHEQGNKTVAHLDLKPSNILLDKKMVPKIADFGLSRAFMINKTHTYTTAAMGTNGYMAPELTEPKKKGPKVGTKCDIYSLGVLILAIVTGKGPTATSDPNGVTFIRNTRESTEKRRKLVSADENRNQLKMDASLLDDACLEDVEKCIDLAFECVDIDPGKRPPATDICGRLAAPVTSTDTTHHVALAVVVQQDEFVEGLDQFPLLSCRREK